MIRDSGLLFWATL